MTWRYRIFGSRSGELTEGWRELEAETREGACAGPIADVANLDAPAQRIHVVLRSESADERLELDFDGERIAGKQWLGACG